MPGWPSFTLLSSLVVLLLLPPQMAAAQAAPAEEATLVEGEPDPTTPSPAQAADSGDAAPAEGGAPAPETTEAARAALGAPADAALDAAPDPPTAWSTPLPMAPGTVELALRMEGSHPDAWLHLRRAPEDPWERACALPCALTMTPGDWHLGVSLAEGEDPIGGDPDPVYLGRSGSVSLRFFPRVGRHVSGALMIIAGVAGVIATAVAMAVLASEPAAYIPQLLAGAALVGGGIGVAAAPRLVRISWSL